MEGTEGMAKSTCRGTRVEEHLPTSAYRTRHDKQGTTNKKRQTRRGKQDRPK
ncbi:hypothetical protein GZL_05732 [Streptomyces sp. 769]|nr:hypothetical protein GZL_05732 [Streptomyces sp. 769]